MTLSTIGFVGAGNMASALIGGLLNGIDSKQAAVDYNVIACDPSQDQLNKLATHLGNPATLTTSTDNAAIADADIIVLAVKPQVVGDVSRLLRDHLRPNTLVISIAAGINCDSLKHWLGDVPMVRCMPNTPAIIKQGATGMYATGSVSNAQKAATERILQNLGIVVWVNDEALIDAVTAISGSGPAYFFLFMEFMSRVGVDMGLDQDAAEKLSIQTGVGACLLAAQSEENLADLRSMVTSPGGTTERAIARFQNDDLQGIVKLAMHDCAERAKAISEEFGA